VIATTFNYSENIERYRKIIQQRIVAVKEEAARKYGNLVESIPKRMQQIIEKKQPEREEDVEVEVEVEEEKDEA
jgi:dihydroneopterin aldolase